MTESINSKKISGIPPGRCIHTQLGGFHMSSENHLSRRAFVAVTAADMDKPLHDAADLIRALVMAIAGSKAAGFSEADDRASLETLARFVQAEVHRSLALWKRVS